MAEFRGVTVDEFNKAFEAVNTKYVGNLVAYDVTDASGPKKGPAVKFRLKVIDSTEKGKGARGGFRTGKGPNGRNRTNSACWHVWYDAFGILASIGINKGREVRTLATHGSGFKWYESDPIMGVTNFLALMDGSNQNYGSEDNPVYAGDLCACED